MDVDPATCSIGRGCSRLSDNQGGTWGAGAIDVTAGSSADDSTDHHRRQQCAGGQRFRRGGLRIAADRGERDLRQRRCRACRREPLRRRGVVDDRVLDHRRNDHVFRRLLHPERCDLPSLLEHRAGRPDLPRSRLRHRHRLRDHPRAGLVPGGRNTLDHGDGSHLPVPERGSVRLSPEARLDRCGLLRHLLLQPGGRRHRQSAARLGRSDRTDVIGPYDLGADEWRPDIFHDGFASEAPAAGRPSHPDRTIPWSDSDRLAARA